MRIAKYLAHAGIESRRNCELLIKSGLISINNKIIHDLSYKIQSDQTVKYKNQIINIPNQARIWAMYKPCGYLCSTISQYGHPTIFSILPKDAPHLILVGRLDLNSEGIILFTNNGDLARHLELPQSKYKRHYKVRVFGNIYEHMFIQLSKGIKIDRINYAPMQIKYLNNKKSASKNQWLDITIYEGKRNEIRKIMEYFNLQVNKLIRLSYAGISALNLKLGEIIEININDYSKIICWKNHINSNKK